LRFLALRRRWYIRLLRYTAPILAGVGPAACCWWATARPSASFWHRGFLQPPMDHLGWLLFIFVTLIAATVRRNFEAGLLLIPLVLTWWAWIEPMLPEA
jgi:hypothetical protein